MDIRKLIQVAQFVADGKDRKEIAKKLKHSPRTIEHYIDKLKFLVDANDTPHLIAILFRQGKLK